MAEVAGWEGSLGLKLERGEGRGFYGVIAVATLVGVALCFSPMDPVRELFWSAVFNGVAAVPIMAAMMMLASSRRSWAATPIGPHLRAGLAGHGRDAGDGAGLGLDERGRLSMAG